MKNLEIEISYKWEDKNGREHTTKASIGGDWQQYGGTQEELSEIMPLTEKLNDSANEFIIDNCEEDED
jgi:hypothetical protein